MAINTKYVALASGAVTVVGGGIGANYLLRDKTTKNEKKDNQTNALATKLVNKGYEIIFSSSEHWKTILESYKTVATANNKLRFETFEGTGDKAEEKLIKYCQNLLKSNTSENVENEDNFKKAEKWCVVPTNVSDILKNEKYTPINSATTDNSVANNSEWVAKIKEHKKSDKKISSLTLDSNQNEATEEDIRKIKEKCTEIGGKKNHESEYETNLENFKNWCSNKPAA